MSHSVYMCAGISGKDLEERDGGFPSSYQYHFWDVAMRARAVVGWPNAPCWARIHSFDGCESCGIPVPA